jgi:hypothetical protein
MDGGKSGRGHWIASPIEASNEDSQAAKEKLVENPEDNKFG